MPKTRQEVAGDPERQAEVWSDLKRMRELLWGFPWSKGELSLRHCPALDQTLEDYTTRGTYDEFWSSKANDFTRYWHEHADIPATMSTGWFDIFCAADSDYYTEMAARNRAPQRLVIGPWSHVGMRGEATFSLDVDFGASAAGGSNATSQSRLTFFGGGFCRRVPTGPPRSGRYASS